MIQPQEVIYIKDGMVEKWEPFTLRFNDLDGVGYGLFLILMEENDFSIAQFTWGVRPNAKAQLKKMGRTGGKRGSTRELPGTNLSFDFATLQGDVPLEDPSSSVTINVRLDQMKIFTFRELSALKAFLERHGMTLLK